MQNDGYYIAILRGINVSGQKKIRMAELRAQLEELNFRNIQSYIQSGNIIFQSEGLSAPELEKVIGTFIYKKYGFQVPVLIRLPSELERIIANNPFSDVLPHDLNRLFVTFLSEIPLEENANSLSKTDIGTEKYELSGSTIYVYTPEGYGKAKMNNNFIESKLKVTATTRNWKTVNTLLEMASV